MPLEHLTTTLHILILITTCNFTFLENKELQAKTQYLVHIMYDLHVEVDIIL